MLLHCTHDLVLCVDFRLHVTYAILVSRFLILAQASLFPLVPPLECTLGKSGLRSAIPRCDKVVVCKVCGFFSKKECYRDEF